MMKNMMRYSAWTLACLIIAIGAGFCLQAEYNPITVATASAVVLAFANQKIDIVTSMDVEERYSRMAINIGHKLKLSLDSYPKQAKPAGLPSLQMPQPDNDNQDVACAA